MLFGKILTIVPEARLEPTIGTETAPRNDRAKTETVTVPASTVLDRNEVITARVNKAGVKGWLLDASAVAAGTAAGGAVASLVGYAVDRSTDAAAGAIGGGVRAGAAFPSEDLRSLAGWILQDESSSESMKSLAGFVLRAAERSIDATGAAAMSLVGHAVDRGVDGAAGALAGGVAAGGAFGF